MSRADALAHIKSAIDELTYDFIERINVETGERMEVPLQQQCIGEDLIRIDRQLTPKENPTCLTHIGRAIQNALAELELAQRALEQ